MSETNIPEQRAVEVGQRRRNHKEIFTIYAIEGSHAIVCRAGQTDPVTDYIHKGDESCCWELISVLADCEIVATATPRCGKPFSNGHVCALNANHMHACAMWRTEIAQPAPQLAPAKLGCTNGRDCLSPTEPVFVRVLRDERQPMCDRCYLDVEANLGKLMMFESSGTPYAGPTRLPRLKLAHVAGMHDDDLIGGRRG